jgi:hypothetical protein
MSPQKIAGCFLHVEGVLLVVLGAIHLIATPHILGLLKGSPPAVYQWAAGPMLLNHVLVGILLLPLGYTTWLAATGTKQGALWAKRILIVNTIVVLFMPVSLVLFMRPSEHYTAPLFLCAVGIVAVISLLMIASTFVMLRGKPN